MGFIKALGAAALFGAATPCAKLLLEGFGENLLAGLLYCGAALALFPFVIKERRRGADLFPSDYKNRRRLFGAILFGGILGPVLALLGLSLASATSVSLWLNLETPATAILAVLIFREHLGRLSWLANLGVCAAGTLLVIQEGWAGTWALAFIAAAAFCWGLDNNLTAGQDGVTPVVGTFWKGAVAGLVNLCIGFILKPSSLDFTWGYALILGGLSYGLSIVWYIESAQNIGAARSQMVFATAPFFGVAGALLMTGETLTLWQIAAGFVLAGSLILLWLDQHSHEHQHEFLEHEHKHRHDDGHHQHEHETSCDEAVHTHRHIHLPVVHTHTHWPDLHHHHRHK